jgi:hypothetical protein
MFFVLFLFSNRRLWEAQQSYKYIKKPSKFERLFLSKRQILLFEHILQRLQLL